MREHFRRRFGEDFLADASLVYEHSQVMASKMQRTSALTRPWVFSRIALVLILIIMPLGFGCLAVLAGQDADWDLLNYHYYDGFAFLHSRAHLDIAPAQMQTFFNPILSVLFYIAVTHLHPKLVGFLEGLIQGSNFIFLFFIAQYTLPSSPVSFRIVLSLLVAMIGVVGAANLSEIGTIMGDNLASLFVLSSLLLLLRSIDRIRTKPENLALLSTALAGLVMGAGVGLKLSIAPYALGGCVAVFSIALAPKRRLGCAAMFATAVVVGFLLADGFWLYGMWLQYGNPLFPFYNNLFRSEYAPIAANVDARWGPRSLTSALFFPFVYASFPRLVSELDFVDLRIPVLYLLFVAAGLRCLDKVSHKPQFTAGHLRNNLTCNSRITYLLMFLLLSYAVWLYAFGYFRYLLPLEMLSPLGIVLLLCLILRNQRIAIALSILCILFLAVTVKPPDWGRVPWARQYFSLNIPRIRELDRSLILIGGANPVSFTIPYFPSSTQFVRIEGNLRLTPRFQGLISQRIRAHDGPIFVMYTEGEALDKKTDAAAASVGVGFPRSEKNCYAVRLRIGGSETFIIRLCEAQKVMSIR